MLYSRQIFVFAISFLVGVFFLLAKAELGYSGIPSPTPPPIPAGACCFSDGSCDVLFVDECAGSGGFFNGPNTTCDPNPCVGACCIDGIDCDDTTEANCEGSYKGDGTSCEEPGICAATGACCFGDGSCEVISEADCTDQKGGYQGDDTECGDNTCKAECPAPEALKCYKVKDLDASYNEGSIQNLVVQLTGIFQFGKETCKIVGNYREFCFPVDVQIGNEETVLDAVDSGLIDPRVDQVCYEIRNCDESEAELPDKVTINDEVGGTREIIFKEGRRPPAPSTLCMPAEKCNEDCAKGEETCELPSNDALTLEGECVNHCRCVPPQPTGCCLELDVSCVEQVTEQDCDHEWIENGVCEGITGCGEPL